MLSFRWAEGTIRCTLLDLEGRTRNEERSVHFESENRIPEVVFSQKERFRFTLTIRKRGRESELTGVTSYSQQGELSFFVFLEEVQRAAFTGSHTFSVPLQPSDPRTQEYSFTFDRVAIIKGISGAVGSMRIELRFKLLV